MEELSTTSPRAHVSFTFDNATHVGNNDGSSSSEGSQPSPKLSALTAPNFPKQITNRQLGHLLPFVPVMIHWLRDTGGPNAGVMLVESSGAAQADVTAEDDLLRKLLDALNFSSDLTINQIRELGNSVNAKIWASTIRRVVLDSEPPLIPTDICQDLLKTNSGAGTGDDAMLRKKKLALDGLTRTHFTALGELCALFRDTKEQEIASLVGVRLINRHANSEESAQAAQTVMQILITHCESLFGRSAVPCNGYCLGDVGRLAASSYTSMSYLPKVSRGDALQSSRKHALKAFFQWNDEQYVSAVDSLFELHSYRDIAWGVWDRYENLPGGWRGELEELKDSGDPDYAWVPAPNQGNKPLFAISSTNTDDDNNNNTSKIGSNGSSRRLLRRPSNWNAPPSSPGFSTLNLVINEILDSEMVYYTMLKELQDNYVSTLRKIASSGGEAALALGISLADIESVFGWRLAQVIETSKTLLGHLAVVNLVRQELPGYPGGRSMVVANAFATIAPDLSSSYAPFISGHRHGMSVLGKASQNLRDSNSVGERGSLLKTRSFFKSVRMPKGKSLGQAAESALHDALSSARAGSSGGGMNTTGGVQFIALWEEMRETSKKLSGQSLQSVMITPVQRIPRYKLLLVELQKKLTQNHPALATLTTALEQISTVAQQVNQALRQHEKLENLIGKDEMPEISGTTTNLNKHQSFRIAVTYKAKKQSVE